MLIHKKAVTRIISHYVSLFPVYFRSMFIPQRRQWHPTPVLLPGKSHGWRSLEGCSPWGCWGSDTTERLHFHFSLSCIGEGNGNPLQCSCLENPRDGGAWWAAVYGVAQSRTQLKRLSSSSSGLFLVSPRTISFSRRWWVWYTSNGKGLLHNCIPNLVAWPKAVPETIVLENLY